MPTVDGVGIVDALDGVAAHRDAAQGSVRVIFVFGIALPQHAVVGGVDGREAVVAVVGIAVSELIFAVGLSYAEKIGVEKAITSIADENLNWQSSRYQSLVKPLSSRRNLVRFERI